MTEQRRVRIQLLKCLQELLVVSAYREIRFVEAICFGCWEGEG